MYIFILIVIIVLFILYLAFFLKRSRKYNVEKGRTLPGLRHCPLCGYDLESNRLYSKLTEYPGGRQVLEIRGCNHCYKQGHVYERKCPRCKHMLGVDDIVAADYDNSSTVTRVHVRGCRHCYRR